MRFGWLGTPSTTRHRGFDRVRQTRLGNELGGEARLRQGVLQFSTVPEFSRRSSNTMIRASGSWQLTLYYDVEVDSLGLDLQLPVAPGETSTRSPR